MKAESFVYWLQGYFEIHGSGPVTLSASQVDTIKNHLNLVFKHEIDPSMGNQAHQAELNAIHSKNSNDWTKEDWTIYWSKKHGPKPHEGWEVGIHGWYDPEQGQPRC